MCNNQCGLKSNCNCNCSSNSGRIVRKVDVRTINCNNLCNQIVPVSQEVANAFAQQRIAAVGLNTPVAILDATVYDAFVAQLNQLNLLLAQTPAVPIQPVPQFNQFGQNNQFSQFAGLNITGVIALTNSGYAVAATGAFANLAGVPTTFLDFDNNVGAGIRVPVNLFSGVLQANPNSRLVTVTLTTTALGEEVTLFLLVTQTLNPYPFGQNQNIYGQYPFNYWDFFNQLNQQNQI